MAEIDRDSSEDGRPMTVKVVEKAIERMRWEEPPNRLPLSPGVTIQQLIRSLELPRVDRISYRNWDLAPYGLYGIQANYSDGRIRMYILDRGHELAVVATDLWPAATVGVRDGVSSPP